MSDKTTLYVPDPPPPSGWTRHLVLRLVARRKALGMTLEDVANAAVEYSAKVAAKYGEKPRWTSLSKQAVSQWEHMFDDNASEQLKDRRVSMAMFDYAIWARCVRMRMFVDFVPTDTDAEHVLLDPPVAKLARQLQALPADQVDAVVRVVDALWKAHPENHAAEDTEAARTGSAVAAAWPTLGAAARRMILAAINEEKG